ncbi:tRNA pseudouridine(55) synthase TruB [Novosphingobium sp. KACC 22771]|uniref:tRNA pseudouridine(55) synthase TruB n=1 Tax=Novosphingobium sp. KACC 22771 TaxID=3025670 RepID=UPI00236594A2|nr:tRNA pseudouridine(55) synthase TruB [Novosphingobium sp. KACC 22771]WDF71794.1 tRNA pseudouridine(55) synthase TruB [Novosphingobium sp. KACC 22771]
MSVHGWIILDKPLELGSTQAVSAVKRNLRAAGYNMKLKGGIKVGHGGTLDPLASGILPIALGEATKLTGRMLDASKTYDFTVKFGEETETLDLEGRVVATSDVRPIAAEIAAVLPSFTGPIEQVPPAYSALMIDGVRAYDRARRGEAVDMPTRAVTIHALDMIDAGEDWATLRAHVSKGTYIRSLARDIALALGTRGSVTMLRRLSAGPFTLDHAISLDSLNEIGQGASLETKLLPLEAGLVDIPALSLSPEQAGAVRQGRVLVGQPYPDGLYLARLGKVPVALMQLEGGLAKVERGFNLSDVAE